MQNFNLPPGVTDADIDRHFGADKLHECRDCGDDVYEGEDCENCGEYCPTEDDLREEAEERKFDAMRDEGLI